MTFGDSCVEHFDEYTVTSSIGRVDVTELSLESDTDLTVNESLQIPQYVTNPPVTSSAGEVWYNTAEEKLYFTYDINSWTDITGMIQGRLSTGIVWTLVKLYFMAGGRIDNTGPYHGTCTELWDGTSWTALIVGVGQSGESIVGTSGLKYISKCLQLQLRQAKEMYFGMVQIGQQVDGGLSVGGHKGGTANASIHTGGSDGSG